MNPHNHLQTLQDLKKEVKDMPTLRKIEDLPPTPQAMDDNEFDLDAELEKLSEEAAATVVEEEKEVPRKTTEEVLQDQILHTLWSRDDAPTKEQVAAWKMKHGEHAVQVISLDPGNVFIFTHLTLGQWEKLQKLSESLQNRPDANLEKAMKEAVVRQAVLWPKLDKDYFVSCRAGIPSTLYELVLINSYFLSPQQAMTLTTRL